MKNKLLVFLGSLFVAIAGISLVIQIVQAKARFLYGHEAGSIDNPDRQAIDLSGRLQAGNGTATLAYYLPLIKADAPLTTPTPTPTHTPTATQIVTWYGEGIYDDIGSHDSNFMQQLLESLACIPDKCPSCNCLVS